MDSGVAVAMVNASAARDSVQQNPGAREMEGQGRGSVGSDSRLYQGRSVCGFWTARPPLFQTLTSLWATKTRGEGLDQGIA